MNHQSITDLTTRLQHLAHQLSQETSEEVQKSIMEQLHATAMRVTHITMSTGDVRQMDISYYSGSDMVDVTLTSPEEDAEDPLNYWTMMTSETYLTEWCTIRGVEEKSLDTLGFTHYLYLENPNGSLRNAVLDYESFANYKENCRKESYRDSEDCPFLAYDGYVTRVSDWDENNSVLPLVKVLRGAQ